MLEIKLPESNRFIEDLVLQRTGPFAAIGKSLRLAKSIPLQKSDRMFFER